MTVPATYRDLVDVIEAQLKATTRYKAEEIAREIMGIEEVGEFEGADYVLTAPITRESISKLEEKKDGS